MAPPAAKNFQQTQPITTGLRIICDSYPANTCLRELLQNADDAKATEIEYVLDTKSYTDGPLLYDALQAYHGPALLARNNRVFSDADFRSLSTVGDSRKMEDAAATGKFGLGFNSVYHWTDGPWIYSRNWLLLLDPHEWWSGDTGKPGGPAWDVVANSDCRDIQNHLATFSTFKLDPSKEIDQAIIRIPLRTSDQAKKSKIVDREVSVDEIKDELRQFAQEMKDGGLLFLKYIRTIILRIDNDIVAKLQILENDPDSLKARNELPLDFQRLYVEQESSILRQDITKIFELQIEYSDGQVSSVDRYLVQHTMLRSTGNQELDKWARKRKLFPWTAVAAPLNGTSRTDSFHGRLFCALRMPILTNHPVHIHGLWSITPDRSRLSSSGQSDGFEDEKSRWNQFMFECCTSLSWTKLLLHRNHISWHEERFDLWPHITVSPMELWNRLDDWIINKVIKERLPVWNTSKRCVSSEEGIFFESNPGNEKYAFALDQVMLPAIYLPADLHQKTKMQVTLLSQTILVGSPPIVRQFLQKNRTFLNPDIPSLLLEYCLLDIMNGDLEGPSRRDLYDSFQSIPIWPVVNGGLAKPGELLLPRSEYEKDLFAIARSSNTIDIGRLEPAVLKLLLEDIVNLSALMRFRSLMDLRIDWPAIYPLEDDPRNSGSLLRRDVALDETLEKIWSWICTRAQQESLSLRALEGLWIIPVDNSRLRQVSPRIQSPLMLVPDKRRPLYETVKNITLGKDSITSPILDVDVLSTNTTKLLRNQAKAEYSFRGACQTHLWPLVSWLAAGEKLLRAASDQQKMVILEELGFLAKKTSLLPSDISAHRNEMRKLPLFSRITSESPYSERTLARCNLDTCKYAVEVPKGLPPLPNIPDVAFYDFSDMNESYLVTVLDLVEKMPFDALVRKHLIPWATDSEGQAKDSLIDFILNHWNSRYPSESWARLISNHPLVPISSCPTTGKKTYQCLVHLVKPGSILSQLYFEHEGVFPERSFYQKHDHALTACGMRSEVTWADVLDRIQYFSKCGANLEELEAKIRCLFDTSLSLNKTPNEYTLQLIRSLKWLPGTATITSPLGLLSPKTCRESDLSAVTDFVLGTTKFKPGINWKKILGWDKRVDSGLLLSQLDICIEGCLHDKIHQVLSYIQPDDYPSLRERKCILGSRKQYLSAESSILPDSLLTRYPMAPFLDEVDSVFATKHSDLIKALEIKKKPSLKDILRVQKDVQALTTILSESYLRVIVSSLQIATRLYKASELTTILVPDTEGVLRNLSDIVHGDRNTTGDIAAFHFTHPAISEEIVQKLDIENSLARATRLAIEFEDEDEDEYTPREKLTTIISDTLCRYPIESTFNEYLANADDCKATKMSWVLDCCDEGPYESTELLTPDLKSMQGPALFAHNDGVFTENDFAGFKEIGRGSKGDDVTSTGMFGRGALSMYHFTDVPMLISGGFFLILDPQQQLLPKNRHYRRKVGVKIPLSTARRICLGQLLPFHEICGYLKDMDYYNGTLFRFCFRQSMPTELIESFTLIDARAAERLLISYREDANLAVLFLRHVRLIEFSVRGENRSRWSVSVDRSEGDEDEIFQRLIVTSDAKDQRPEVKKWRIGITDIDESPTGIIKPGRGAGKVTECGIAACLSNIFEPQRVFCTLPTVFKSTLPVSFHASFAITGDRRTIPFESFHQDSSITKWNMWLLHRISKFYLEFLKDLAPRLGEKSFDYWPTTRIFGSSKTLSDVVATGFWDKLEQNAGLQLLPLARSNLSPVPPSTLTVRPGGNRRKLYPVTSLSSAQLDFLPSKTSSKIRPLLLKLCPTLVCLPRRLWSDMKTSNAFDVVTKLGPESLCNILREEINWHHLPTFLESEEEGEKVEVMEMLLETIVPELGDDPKALNILSGCKVLPKLDGSFAVIRLANEANAECYLVATEKEQELFRFAADSFVDTRPFRQRSDIQSRITSASTAVSKVTRNPIADLAIASLNVRNLEPADIGNLLARSSSPINKNDSTIRDWWIMRFWSYLNGRPLLDESGSRNACSTSIAEFVAIHSLQKQRICRVRCRNQWEYFSPHELANEPCILRSSADLTSKLCSQITDLKLIDRSCIPTQLSLTEYDLEDPAAFARLLGAFRIIQNRLSTSINIYLASKLTAETQNILRDMVLHYLYYLSSRGKRLSQDELSILRALRIWPCHVKQSTSQSPNYISANQGRFCKHSKMLMPWVAGLELFVDPEIVKGKESLLKLLGIHAMTVEVVWEYVKIGIPTSFDEVGVQAYKVFIQYLAAHNVRPSINIALNGFGSLCNPKSLFDHRDSVFSAAFFFRRQMRFLHPDLQSDSLREFWMAVGLKRGPDSGVMADVDFLDCARAIEARNNNTIDPSFNQDAEKVAKQLCWDLPLLRQWRDHVWEKISNLCIFLVEHNVDEEPIYRQARMRKLAANETYDCLANLGRKSDKSIVWSQVAFPNDTPAPFVYGKLPNGGFPSVEKVVEHIKYLVDMLDMLSLEDVPEYLKDIQASYGYLSDRISSARGVRGIQDAKIWINLDTTDINAISATNIKDALLPASLLCLNCPTDPLPLRVARKFLVPYEPLLKALGCQSVVQPTLRPRNSANSSEFPMAASMAKMRELRDQEILIDVIFEVDGQEKKAHRIVMAAVSEYCQAQFSGEWGRSLQQVAKVRLEDIKYKTLSQMVDFAYSGEITWPTLTDRTNNDEIAEKLDELLDLLQATDMWFLTRLHDITEYFILAHSDLYVRPDNVLDVQEIAKAAQATRLFDHCQAFVNANSSFVAALSQG